MNDTLSIFIDGLAFHIRDEEAELICRYLGVEPTMYPSATMIYAVFDKLLARAKAAAIPST